MSREDPASREDVQKIAPKIQRREKMYRRWLQKIQRREAFQRSVGIARGLGQARSSRVARSSMVARRRQPGQTERAYINSLQPEGGRQDNVQDNVLEK